MKRKIVKQGAATMTISLPASWIKKFNLKVGDELEIDEVGNKIEISTEKAMGPKKAELDASKLGRFTKNDLSHLYILGYDEIIINFKDEDVLKQIKDRIPDCIGYEIIDQTENKIIIKSISSALEEEFDNILRKVFLILKEMADNIYQALKNKEFLRLKQIRDMETINNKFTSFLLRLLMKKGYKKKPSRTLQAYDMVQNLERAADEYKYICDDLADAKKPIDKEVLALLKELNNYYETLYHLYYKSDPVKKIQIYKRRKELKDRATKFLKTNKEIVLSHHLIALLEKIYNTAGSYLAIVTD
jgi:phosphate uptake regulator